MTKPTCSVDACERERYARTLCFLHYERQRRTGTIGPPHKVGRRGCVVAIVGDGTALVPLTRGKSARVDAADAEWLSEWAWAATRRTNGKWEEVRGARTAGHKHPLTMHRAILGLVFGDGKEADHVNHDTLDNRRANLRVVTPNQNKKWIASREGTSSQYVGVTWDKQRQRWRAQIQVDGKVRNLGRYDTEEGAALARDAYVIANDLGYVLNLPKGDTRAGSGY